MKKLCVIGIGGIGTNWVDEIANRLANNSQVTTMSIDTDKLNILQSNCTYLVDVSYPNKMEDMLSYMIENDINLFEKEDISELGYILSLPMDKGANAWRFKAFATFVAYMCNQENKDKFDEILRKTFSNTDEELSIYIVTSLAGGTGSALCLPVSLYLKKYLKEIGVTNVDVTLFAICPDMFSETMNLEMRTKSYANAYASLYEINLINEAILGKENQSIKVGFENEKSFGLLFDAKDSKFLQKEYMPFDNVVLFDKMIGVSSVDFHINLFANYVCNYYLGYKNNFNNNLDESAIFRAYNIIEFDYCVESIIDYIAKHKAYNTVKNELLDFYKKVEKYEPLYQLDNCNDLQTYKVESFVNKIKGYFDYCEIDSDEKAAYALNRFNAESEFLPFIDDETWLDNYTTNLSNDLYKLIKTKNYEYIYSRIYNNAYNKSKRRNVNNFINEVDNLYIELTEAYFNFIKDANKLDDNSIFLSDEVDNVFSIVNNVLKDNGEFIHPTISLIRLTQLYKKIKNKVEKKFFYKKQEILYDKKQKSIPEEFLNLYTYEIGGKGYGKLLQDRFKRVIAKINTNEKKINIEELSRKERKEYLQELKKHSITNVGQDAKYILSDFKYVLENITSEVKNVYLIKLLNAIKYLITSYCEIINELNINLYKLENEVEVSKKAKVSNCVYYGIGTSLKNRESSLKNYYSSVPHGESIKDDALLGKIVFDYAKNQGDINSFINDFINGILNSIKNSEYFSEISNKNIFEKLFDDNDLIEVNNFKLAMKMEGNVLIENNSKIIRKRTLYLSPKIAEYVLKNKKQFKVKSNNIEEVIDELLISLGEYDTHVELSDTVSKNKAFLTIEKCGIKLNDVSKYAGDKFTSIYKSAYKKSLLNMQKYSSIMWNPHVFE